MLLPLVFLGLLLIAVYGWLRRAPRRDLGRAAQAGGLWIFIMIGLLASYGLWNDAKTTLLPRQSLLDSGEISLPRGPGGHYFLTLAVNGTDVRFLVDTGASALVLSREDAARAGITPGDLSFIGTASTANGTVKTAPVTIDSLTLGEIDFGRFRAAVNGGELEESLLGMSFLSRFSRIEIANGEMRLTP